MKVFRLFLIALSMAASSNAVAGTIHIELTSLIQSPTGDFEASAFFDLDADQFLGTTGFDSDILLDAGFESPVLSGSIIDSSFNIGLARNLSGGVVGFSLTADYGPQIFFHSIPANSCPAISPFLARIRMLYTPAV